MKHFPASLTLDERDRDVIAALGAVLTPLQPEALKVVLMPSHAGVSTLGSDELNARLAGVTVAPHTLTAWGLSYDAHRRAWPRDTEEAPPEEEERDERFASVRERLSSTAAQ